MKNHIVILGGMGPQVSIRLHNLLIETENGLTRRPDEFPTILHLSMAIPDFIESREATKDAVNIIQSACSSVPLESASAIGIACNTAHLLLGNLTNIPRHNFVSMIEVVTDDISSRDLTKVGLLASPVIIKSRLYHDALSRRGIAVIQPAKSDIAVLNTVIHDVIGGVSPGLLRAKLTKIAAKLQSNGVDCILLGCTELPLVGVDTNLPVIDSLSCLAQEMLKKHQSTV
jgi:aspartate racemase